MKTSTRWPLAITLLLIGSGLGLLIGMFVGGAANPPGLIDASIWLRWAAPGARVIYDIAQALTIG